MDHFGLKYIKRGCNSYALLIIFERQQLGLINGKGRHLYNIRENAKKCKRRAALVNKRIQQPSFTSNSALRTVREKKHN